MYFTPNANVWDQGKQVEYCSRILRLRHLWHKQSSYQGLEGIETSSRHIEMQPWVHAQPCVYADASHLCITMVKQTWWRAGSATHWILGLLSHTALWWATQSKAPLTWSSWSPAYQASVFRFPPHFKFYSLGCGASCESSDIRGWKHRCMWCATKPSW